MNTVPEDAWRLLSPALTDSRREKLFAAACKRTFKVQLVIQDVHQPHNISACLRTAEAFGIQKCHIVSHKTKFRASTVARGVHHWIELIDHPSIEECAQYIRAQNIKIALAYPQSDAYTLAELPITADSSIALVFGNEHAGLDEKWLEFADYSFAIPMQGLVESLNISVSAAISLFVTSSRMQNINNADKYFLSLQEREVLLNSWAFAQFPQAQEQLEILRQKPYL